MNNFHECSLIDKRKHSRSLRRAFVSDRHLARTITDQESREAGKFAHADVRPSGQTLVGDQAVTVDPTGRLLVSSSEVVTLSAEQPSQARDAAVTTTSRSVSTRRRLLTGSATARCPLDSAPRHRRVRSKPAREVLTFRARLDRVGTTRCDRKGGDGDQRFGAHGCTPRSEPLVGGLKLCRRSWGMHFLVPSWSDWVRHSRPLKARETHQGYVTSALRRREPRRLEMVVLPKEAM
jgi:hypothetical protein